MGALRSTDVPESQLCAAANVDRERLEAYVRVAVAEFVPPLAAKPLIGCWQGVQIFDFSERKVSNRASVLVDADELGGKRGAQVLVTRIGDALQEPFWPEGLGINRGFLGALDCAYLVQHLAVLRSQPQASEEDCIAMRENLFGLTKVISGHNRTVELRPHLEGAQWKSDAEKRFCYTISPATRYTKVRD